MPNRGRLGLLRLAAAVGIALMACPAPGRADFYKVTPAEVAGPPGTIIRAEPLYIYPVGSRGYRILYRSTGLDGEPIAVSGIVAYPVHHKANREIVAWAHPTTGVARKCAPSLSAGALNTIPALRSLLAQGYVVTATDYPGLGTYQPHPYLVGVSEGRAVLDSVRAIRHLDDAGAGDSYVIWGHSQGGHAALFAGELASSYAPELNLVGVAAAAPATELGKLFEDDLNTTGGKVLTSLAITAWSKLYGIPLETVVRQSRIPDVEKIGRQCITGGPRDIFIDLISVRQLKKRFLSNDPVTTPPWSGIVSTNVPGKRPAGAPVFLAQGSFDKVVDPPVTKDFAARLCRQGTPVRFFWVPQATHDTITNASAAATISWMADRFAGAPAPSDCR